MFDQMVFGGGLSSQIGVNVAENANESPRLAAVSKNNVGMIARNRNMTGGEIGGDFYGRLSVGILEGLVVLLIVSYLWSHNVQGGG